MTQISVSPKVTAVLKRHGAEILSLSSSTMKIGLSQWSSSVADKVYNQLRNEARVSSMISIIVEGP